MPKINEKSGPISKYSFIDYFISKLVCDKCGTEVSTSDKFCRECGERGRSKFYDEGKTRPVTPSLQDMLDKFKTPSVEMYICKSCGKVFNKYSSHQCEGLVPKGHPGIEVRYQWESTLDGPTGNIGPR